MDRTRKVEVSIPFCQFRISVRISVSLATECAARTCAERVPRGMMIVRGESIHRRYKRGDTCLYMLNMGRRKTKGVARQSSTKGNSVAREVAFPTSVPSLDTTAMNGYSKV
jgi:hypothetical protein